MRFRPRSSQEEPEINLIPFIDVLLVVLIFLMTSTTYSRMTALKVTLPSADAPAAQQQLAEIHVVVGADGRYAVGSVVLSSQHVEELASAMRLQSQGRQDAMVVISADANAPHQAVINVKDAARRAGLSRLTYAAQHSKR